MRTRAALANPTLQATAAPAAVLIIMKVRASRLQASLAIAAVPELIRSIKGNAQPTMKLLPIVLTVTVIAFVGCSTQSSHNPAGAAAAVTDLGRVSVVDRGSYNCTLSGNRNCQVRLTSLADQQVLVEAVVTERDEQDHIKILARPSAVASSGQRVSLGFGEEGVSLIPEVKLPAN